MRRGIIPTDVERLLNFIGMLGMTGVLIGAFYYQFANRELPCTLCLLQRLAMIAVAIGAAMNVVLGPAARHYGVCLVSAMFGLALSIRQSLLHINPNFDKEKGQPTLDAMAIAPFGEAVMGLHLYIWGVLIFAIAILLIGLVQMLGTQSEPQADETRADEPAWLSRLGAIGVGLLVIVSGAETISTFLECGFGDCPNDGGWDWWFLR